MQEQIKDCQIMDERVSERISILRFPLCVGVVLYHSFAWLPKGTEYLTSNVSEYIVRFLDIFVGKQAVLVFFIISGYLLRKKDDKYLIALKKRVKTLLIPFILWPLLNLAFFMIYESITHNLNSYVDNLRNTYPNILSFYIGYGSDMFLNHLWYIRDLIGLIIISPILLYTHPSINSYTKKLLLRVLFLFLIVLLNIFRIFHPSFDTEELSISLLFFYLGIMLANYDKIIIDLLDKLFIVFLSVLAAGIIALYFINYYKQFNTVCELIRFISGILLSFYIFRIAKYFTKVEKIKNLGVLSFWIYCAHEPFLMICIQKCTIFLFNKADLMNFYLLHASIFFLDIILSILTGSFVFRFLPHIFSILTGKRYKKRTNK